MLIRKSSTHVLVCLHINCITSIGSEFRAACLTFRYFGFQLSLTVVMPTAMASFVAFTLLAIVVSLSNAVIISSGELLELLQENAGKFTSYIRKTCP